MCIRDRSGPYDNSKLENIEGALSSESGWIEAGGGAVGSHHFWGEPLFGYYTSDDEWVMRKHIQIDVYKRQELRSVNTAAFAVSILFTKKPSKEVPDV